MREQDKFVHQQREQHVSTPEELIRKYTDLEIPRETADTDTVDEMGLEVCPICGKRYLPAPFHAYKIYINKSNGKKYGVVGGYHYKVCSWGCVRKYEKSL